MSEIQASLPPAQYSSAAFPESELPSHLTLIEQVYFQMPHEEPEGLETRVTRIVQNSGEEPYNRRRVVSEEPFRPFPEKETPATVVIKNLAGSNPQRVLSQAEKAEIEKAILHVFIGTSKTPLIVRPGSTCRFELVSASDVSLVASAPNTLIKTRSYLFPS